MKKRPVIIDCDPGIDDTFAILLAASSEDIEIKAINPVMGNVSYENTSRNALGIKDMLGLNCRVGKGADHPLIKSVAGRTAEYVHGGNGLGGYKLKEATSSLDKDYAWDIVYDEALRAEGNLEIIALGPLTNIALTILRYPEIEKLIKKITIMGGSSTYGNVGAYPEFNIWVDPDACDIVLKSKIPIELCGLDGLDFCTLTIDEFTEKISNNKIIKDFSLGLFGNYISSLKEENRNSFAIYDLVTMAIFLNPEIGYFNKYYVSCETKSTISAGQTVVDRYFITKNQPNTYVLESSDKKLYLKAIDKMVDFYTDFSVFK